MMDFGHCSTPSIIHANQGTNFNRISCRNQALRAGQAVSQKECDPKTVVQDSHTRKASMHRHCLTVTSHRMNVHPFPQVSPYPRDVLLGNPGTTGLSAPAGTCSEQGPYWLLVSAAPIEIYSSRQGAECCQNHSQASLQKVIIRDVDISVSLYDGSGKVNQFPRGWGRCNLEFRVLSGRGFTKAAQCLAVM